MREGSRESIWLNLLSLQERRGRGAGWASSPWQQGLLCPWQADSVTGWDLWSCVLTLSLRLSPKPDSPPIHSTLRHWLPSCISFSMSYSRGSSWPRGWTQVSCFAGGFFTTEPPGKPLHLLFCLNHPFILLKPKNTDWYTKSKSRNKNSNGIS